MIMFNFRGRVIFVIFEGGEVKSKRSMSRTKGLNVVFERPFVFEIRATNAVPNLTTVFLVGSPIAFNSERFGTFSAHKGFDAVLSLVMCLEGSKVLEWP